MSADYKDADGYKDLDDDKGEEKGPIADGFDPYEIVDRKVHIKMQRLNSQRNLLLHPVLY